MSYCGGCLEMFKFKKPNYRKGGKYSETSPLIKHKGDRSCDKSVLLKDIQLKKIGADTLSLYEKELTKLLDELTKNKNAKNQLLKPNESTTINLLKKYQKALALYCCIIWQNKKMQKKSCSKDIHHNTRETIDNIFTISKYNLDENAQLTINALTIALPGFLLTLNNVNKNYKELDLRLEIINKIINSCKNENTPLKDRISQQQKIKGKKLFSSPLSKNPTVENKKDEIIKDEIIIDDNQKNKEVINIAPNTKIKEIKLPHNDSTKNIKEIFINCFFYLAKQTFFLTIKDKKPFEDFKDNSNLATFHAFIGTQLLHLFKNSKNTKQILDKFDIIIESFQYYLLQGNSLITESRIKNDDKRSAKNIPNLTILKESFDKLKNIINKDVKISGALTKKLKTNKKIISLFKTGLVKKYVEGVLESEKLDTFKNHIKFLNRKFKIKNTDYPKNILGLTHELLYYIAYNLDFKIYSPPNTNADIPHSSKYEFKKLLALLTIERLRERLLEGNKVTTISDKNFIEKPFAYIKYKMTQKLNCSVDLIENNITENRQNIFTKYPNVFKDTKKVINHLNLPLQFNGHNDNKFLYLQLINDINNFHKEPAYKPYLESFKRYTSETKTIKTEHIGNQSMFSTFTASTSFHTKLLINKGFSEKIAFFAIKKLFTFRSKHIFNNFDTSMNSYYAQKRIDFAKNILITLQNRAFCSAITNKEQLQDQFKELISHIDIGDLQLHKDFLQNLVDYITVKCEIFPETLPPLKEEEVKSVFVSLRQFVNSMGKKKLSVQKTWNTRIKTLENNLEIPYTTSETKKGFGKK